MWPTINRKKGRHDYGEQKKAFDDATADLERPIRDRSKTDRLLLVAAYDDANNRTVAELIRHESDEPHVELRSSNEFYCNLCGKSVKGGHHFDTAKLVQHITGKNHIKVSTAASAVRDNRGGGSLF
jgi:hypothetical protein